MKFTTNFLVLIFGLLLANTIYAESPREELKQMVQQLQQTPDDHALREKIIKLAQTMKPSPALPDTAVAFEGRAQFAFKSAKSEDDYLAAAQEYEKAVAVAPWVPGYYADLCTIYEKAGVFLEAKMNCELSLIGISGAVESMEIKRRIAGLDYMAGKYSSNILQSNLSVPFDGALPELPSGTRYFCYAVYHEYGNPFDGYKPDKTSGRLEQWIVINGATATIVDVGYLDATAFAEVIKNGRLRYAAKYLSSVQKRLKNPMMETSEVPRDETLRNTFIYWSHDRKEELQRITATDDGSKVVFLAAGLVTKYRHECNRR